MGQILAIDFGTTNSVVAHWNADAGSGEAVFIPSLSMPAQASGQPLVPSLVYVQDGQAGTAVIGQSVVEGHLTEQHDNRLFRNFKRNLLNRPLPEPRFIDGVPWDDLDAGKLFMKKLLDALPFTGQDVEQLIFTAPVAAFESYLTWLDESAAQFGKDTIRVVDESTAAALGYSVTEPGALVLVFDFGGGSLDISLVQLPESREGAGGWLNALRGKSIRKHTARVIAKHGLTLGGNDVDRWLLLEALERSHLAVQQLADDYAPLLTLCEQAKVQLSIQTSAQIQFTTEAVAHQVTFSQADFQRLLDQHGFFQAINQAVDRVMQVAQRQGIFKEDIQHVLMVGGTSLIPAVQETLKAYFQAQAVRVDKPFTAIAEGALQLAAGLGLDDYLAHSYGLRYLDASCGQPRYDEIVPEGSRYPTHKPLEVILQAARDGQTAVEFVVGEIVTDAVSAVDVQYDAGQAIFIAHARPDSQQIHLINEPGTTLAFLSPAGQLGLDRLRASLSVDEKRRLRLTVFDLLSQKELLHDVVLAALQGSSIQPVVSQEQPGEDLIGVSGLEPALAARAEGKRRLSLRSLGTYLNLLSPEEISLEAAAEALHSRDFYVRFGAAKLLSQRGDRDARRILQDVLEHGSPPQRASVAHHVYRFSWFVAQPMLRQALGDPDMRVREGAIYALCQLRGPEAYGLLLEILPQAGDRLRMATAWGLSRDPDPASVPVMEVVLQATDPEVRVQGLEVMGATQAQQAIPAVRRSLDDENLEVVYAAVLSWMELEGEKCLPELAQRIRNSESQVRPWLVRGLFHASNYLFLDIGKSPDAEEVIQALQACLEDSQPATRLAAVMPLAWIRHPLAAAALLKGYAGETDLEVKSRLLFVAVQLMSPAGMTLLQEALCDPDPQIRQVAENIQMTRINRM